MSSIKVYANILTISIFLLITVEIFLRLILPLDSITFIRDHTGPYLPVHLSGSNYNSNRDVVVRF